MKLNKIVQYLEECNHDALILTSKAESDNLLINELCLRFNNLVNLNNPQSSDCVRKNLELFNELDILMSRVIGNSANFLIAQYKGLLVCVFQYVSSADFIYFPSENIVYKICHATNNLVYHALKLLRKELLTTSHIDQTKCGGIIVAHARPYHFFYDTALMIECILCCSDLLEDKIVFQFLSSDFIDLEKLNLPIKHSVVIDWNNLNKRAIAQNEYYIKIGLNFGHNALNKNFIDLSKSFDNRMMEAYRNTDINSALYDNINKKKNLGYFILWFGITGDKRSWIEQIDAAVELCFSLSQIHQVCLLVDGVTKSMSATEDDVQNLTKNDKVVLSKLRAKLRLQNFNRAVSAISLIGANSEEKLKISQLVDFHVSNEGTGSFWVSRVAQKMGVLHLSQAFHTYAFYQHIQHHSTIYPIERVKDIPNNKVAIDYISYSIPTKDFMEYVKLNFPIIFEQDYHDWCKFYTKNIHNLQVKDLFINLYTSINNDPQIYLDFIQDNKLTATYTLKVRAYIDFIDSTSSGLAKLYFDFGQGFSEVHSEKFTLSEMSNGFIEFSTPINQPIYNLRFDPIDANCEMVVKGVFYKIIEV